MRFRYIGEAPEEGTICFETVWKAAEVKDVTDPAVIAKMSRNRFFQAVDQPAEAVPEPAAEAVAEAPKRKPGRPKKVENDPDNN